MVLNIAKRVWHVLRTVRYMLRKGVSKRKLMLDLRLLLQRGKIAGKAISNLMTFHHNQHKTATAASGGFSSVSCRNMNPNFAYYYPNEIEFSCSNTPVVSKRSSKNRRRGDNDHYYNLDAEAVKRIFEILNTTDELSDADFIASPSPAPLSMLGFSPAGVPVRRVRITDSPFPIKEEEGEAAEGSIVDRAAEEFIKRFYEQLRRQMAVATPECGFHGHRDQMLISCA